MTLQEKRDLLISKQKKYSKLQKKSKKLQEEINKKDLTISEEEIAEIKAQVDALVETANTVKEEIDSLSAEIEKEEKELEELAKKTKKRKELKKDMEYLKTKQSVVDFANIVSNAKSPEEAKKLWEENLKTKNVTNPEVFLPAGIISEITNILTDDKEIYDTFAKTGLDVLITGIDTTNDGSERARGHKRGKVKKEENITISKKEIRPQIVYKYLTLDKETIREQKDTGALIKYVSAEMVKAIYKEIARAAIIGDGRSDDDAITKFEAIAKLEAPYVASIEKSENIYEDLVKLVNKVKASGKKYLVLSSDTLTEIQLSKDGNGSYIFPQGAGIETALKVEKVFTPDWMDGQEDVLAVAYVGDAYKVVGDATFESYDNFILSKNQNEYLTEIYQGGGLVYANAGAVLKKAAE